eukprot:1137031-Pelagomonas_calceolata.AAC.4
MFHGHLEQAELAVQKLSVQHFPNSVSPLFLSPQMERYIYRRRADGIFIINLEKTYEKLQMAARVIVAIENPQDVMVQSARPYGQRAVFKFAQYLNCKYSAGRHTPGTFTNQSQKNFEEPRLLILTDPRWGEGVWEGVNMYWPACTVGQPGSVHGHACL